MLNSQNFNSPEPDIEGLDMFDISKITGYIVICKGGSKKLLLSHRQRILDELQASIEHITTDMLKYPDFGFLHNIQIIINPKSDTFFQVLMSKRKNSIRIGARFIDVWMNLKEENRMASLAFSLGHEYGHIFSDDLKAIHKLRRRLCHCKQVVPLMILGILSKKVQQKPEYKRISDLIQKNNHRREFSADAFASNFCTILGYDPNVGINTMEVGTRFLWCEDPNTVSLSHPSTENRIDRILEISSF